MMKSAIPIAEMRQGTTATIVSLGPLQGARVRRVEGNEWVQLTANAPIKADDFHTWTREQLPTFKVLPNWAAEQRFLDNLSSIVDKLDNLGTKRLDRRTVSRRMTLGPISRLDLPGNWHSIRYLGGRHHGNRTRRGKAHWFCHLDRPWSDGHGLGQAFHQEEVAAGGGRTEGYSVRQHSWARLEPRGPKETKRLRSRAISDRTNTGYKNAEVDKLIDQQSAEVDREKRKKIVWEVEKKLAEDVARPIIGYNVANTCWDPKLKGLVVQVNSIYNGWRFEDVWLDR
jgi:hypothetical protein